MQLSTHEPAAEPSNSPGANLIDDYKDVLPEVLKIRTLFPFKQLSDTEFATIIPHAQVEYRESGVVMFQAGRDDDWVFCLLHGEVEISDDSESSFRIEGGSLEAALPLSTHDTARVLATVVRDACYVRVRRDLIGAKTCGSREGAFEVEELDQGMEAFDKRVMFAVYHDLIDGSLTLPSLPQVATKIREVLSNPDSHIDDIAKIAQTDASVAVYCVRITNSAAYAARAPVTEVREAIVRIGVAATRDLITAYTLKGVFAITDQQSRTLMQQAWRHSCRIAALSYVIARHSKRINPEKALLAGLVHDIGILVLIREWNLHANSRLTEDKLRSFGDELKGSIGSMILRGWHLPDQIVSTTLKVERWHRNENDSIDLCDCIILAHAHDTSPPGWSSPLPPIEEIPAYRKLSDGSLSASHRLLVVEEAEKELQAMNEILGGNT